VSLLLLLLFVLLLLLLLLLFWLLVLRYITVIATNHCWCRVVSDLSSSRRRAIRIFAARQQAPDGCCELAIAADQAARHAQATKPAEAAAPKPPSTATHILLLLLLLLVMVAVLIVLLLTLQSDCALLGEDGLRQRLDSNSANLVA
jgi:hypothetical protein